MEGIERTNVVVVRGSGIGAGQNVGVPPRWDTYAIEVDVIVRECGQTLD